MPTNSLSGLVILSLGILGIIISFLIQDKRKYFVALSLAGLVVLLGIYQYASTSLHYWQASRRVVQLQKQQRLNLETLQERLREVQSQGKK
jgi:hypothetical protein